MNRVYKVWNRQDKINGVEAKIILEKQPFCAEDGDIILIANASNPNKITNIECKSILSSIFDIDISLNIYEFMKTYFEKTKVKTDIEN